MKTAGSLAVIPLSEDHIEISRDRLAVRCTHCHKSLSYQKLFSEYMWAEMRKAFIRKHRECGD